VLAGEHAGELHLSDLLLESGKKFADFCQGRFVFPFFPELGQNLEILEFLTGLLPGFDDFLQAGALPQQLLRLFPPVPEIRFGDFGIEFSDTLFLCRDVKDTPSALRA